jgi:hypothetical protein
VQRRALCETSRQRGEIWLRASRAAKVLRGSKSSGGGGAIALPPILEPRFGPDRWLGGAKARRTRPGGPSLKCLTARCEVRKPRCLLCAQV